MNKEGKLKALVGKAGARRGLVIFSKVVTFTLISAWIMGFLAFGLYLWPKVALLLGISTPGNFLKAWYITTLLVVATFTAWRGFSSVGKWEKAEDKDDNSEPEVS